MHTSLNECLNYFNVSLTKMYRYYSWFECLDFVTQISWVYAGAVAVYTYPGGTGSIHLDDLHCTGHESRLIDCPHRGVGVHNCVHSKDAGVHCVRPCMLMRNLCCYYLYSSGYT